VLDLTWLGIEPTSWATLKQSVTFLKMTVVFKNCQTLFNNKQLFPSWKVNIHSYQIEKQLFLILDAVRNPDRNHKLWNFESIEKKYFICRYCWNFATYTWKVHNGKIKINSFNERFLSYRDSLSLPRRRPRYETNLAVSVVSFLGSAMDKMRSTLSPNLELISEKTSST
jgi:hypothetical protein